MNAVEDTSEYAFENLNEFDAKMIQGMEELCMQVLTRDIIDEYLRERSEWVGREQAKLLKELYLPFLSFVRQSCGRYAAGKVVDCIDNYPEEELKRIKKSKERVIKERNDQE